MLISSTIGHGLAVQVAFSYHAGLDAKLYGDDAHPEEPAELEVTSIWATIDPAKHNIIDSLSEDEMECMHDLCWQRVNELAELATDG